MARRYRIIPFTVSCRKISIILNAGARYGRLSIEPMKFLALRKMFVVLILPAITLIARARWYTSWGHCGSPPLCRTLDSIVHCLGQSRLSSLLTRRLISALSQAT
jgi:hypothetical protein